MFTFILMFHVLKSEQNPSREPWCFMFLNLKESTHRNLQVEPARSRSPRRFSIWSPIGLRRAVLLVSKLAVFGCQHKCMHVRTWHEHGPGQNSAIKNPLEFSPSLFGCNLTEPTDVDKKTFFVQMHQLSQDSTDFGRYSPFASCTLESKFWCNSEFTCF